MNIDSANINEVHRTKNYYQALNVETSCPELSKKQLDQLEFWPLAPTVVAPWVEPNLT